MDRVPPSALMGTSASAFLGAVEAEASRTRLAQSLCDKRNAQREKTVLRMFDDEIARCRGLDAEDTARATYLAKQRSRMEVVRGDAAIRAAFTAWVSETIGEAEPDQCPACKLHFFELEHAVCGSCMRAVLERFRESEACERVFGVAGMDVSYSQHQQEGSGPVPQESGSDRAAVGVSRLDWIAVLEWFVICTIFGIASGVGLYLLRE